MSIAKRLSNKLSHNDNFYQWKPDDTYEVIDQVFPCEPSRMVAKALLFAGKIMQTPEAIGHRDGNSIVSRVIRFADEHKQNV